MPTPRKPRVTPPLEPKAWSFEIEGLTVQISKEDDGNFRVGSQVTPPNRRKTCNSYEEALEEAPVIAELTQALLDANTAVEEWMDPMPGPPAPEPNRAARRAKR